MTTFALRTASPAKTRAEAVVVGVLPDGVLAPGAEDVAAAYGRKLAGLLATLGVKGAAGEVAKAYKVKVFPTTVLFAADGRPRWRVTGALDWTSPEAGKLVERLWT